MAGKQRTTRFSGADWADQLHPIMLVGVGGIGSWTALNLARIGHELFLIDPDEVDETNVTGGQLYKNSQVGTKKVAAVQELCMELGVITPINIIDEFYTEESGSTDIMITGLDNMKARKLTYGGWKAHVMSKPEEERASCLFIDGRLTLEMYEIFTVQGNRLDQMEKYETEALFDDSETVELDCTTKQSTFGAMGISSNITATLCNWLTNQKLEIDFREVPYYQRNFFPIFEFRKVEVGQATDMTPTQVMETIQEIAEGVLPGNNNPEALIVEHREPRIPSESVQHYKSLFI